MSSATQSATAPSIPAGARYGRDHGIHVIRVEGTQYEMGYQHGRFLAEHIPDGPLPYFRSYIERLVGTSGLGPLGPVAWPLIQKTLGRKIADQLPGFAQESLRGLADGSGMPYEEVLAGATMPDALLWIASRMMRMRRIGPAVHHRIALGFGCTSALAWGDATADGALLHARNFDYHGVASWPKTSTVIFHAPEKGQRYASVSAAGVPMGGATAMNEAGLTLTVHQHMFTNATALGGTPIGLVGDIVMREATNLEEAEKILGAHRPIGCWTYLISDGRQKEVLCWEENPRRNVAMRVPVGEDTFGYSNIYIDPELGKTETDLYGSYWRHNLGRLQRTRSLLAEKHGDLTATDMAGILADTGDPDCRLRHAIRMLMTVASVVFRPEDGVFWVATGDAPVSENPFVPFSLATEGPAPEMGSLTGHVADPPGSVEAFAAYSRAYVAYMDHGDLRIAHDELERAVDLAPNQALYASVRGLVELQSGKGERAADSFDRALSLGHPDPERITGFHVWRGRAADLAGRREDALQDYRVALDRPADAPMHRAARRGLRRPYTRRRARAISVDFAFGDVVAP